MDGDSVPDSDSDSVSDWSRIGVRSPVGPFVSLDGLNFYSYAHKAIAKKKKYIDIEIEMSKKCRQKLIIICSGTTREYPVMRRRSTWLIKAKIA